MAGGGPEEGTVKRENCQEYIQKWMEILVTEAAATASACRGGSCGVRGGEMGAETVAAAVEEWGGSLVISFHSLGDLGPEVESVGVGACRVRFRNQVLVGTWASGVEVWLLKNRTKWLDGSF